MNIGSIGIKIPLNQACFFFWCSFSNGGWDYYILLVMLVLDLFDLALASMPWRDWAWGPQSTGVWNEMHHFWGIKRISGKRCRITTWHGISIKQKWQAAWISTFQWQNVVFIFMSSSHGWLESVSLVDFPYLLVIDVPQLTISGCFHFFSISILVYLLATMITESIFGIQIIE